MVVPASLRDQWKSMFAKHSSGLNIVEPNSDPYKFPKTLPRNAVVLISYEMLAAAFKRDEHSEDGHPLFKRKFGLMVLDEAHNIKNLKLRGAACDAVIRKFAVLATGTCRTLFDVLTVRH